MLVHRATRAAGATGPPRDPARGRGRVRHRGRTYRGARGQGMYTRGGEGTQPAEEAVSDTGEGPTEGPGEKVCTPRGGEETQAEEEAVSNPGEEPTAEGPGDKVCTPGGGEETHPEEEAVSETGQGPTEGLVDKVRTPREGRRPSLRRRRCPTPGRGRPRGQGTRYIHLGGGHVRHRGDSRGAGDKVRTPGGGRLELGDKVCTPGGGDETKEHSKE